MSNTREIREGRTSEEDLAARRQTIFAKIDSIIRTEEEALIRNIEDAINQHTNTTSAGTFQTSDKKNLKNNLPWFKNGMRGFLRKVWYGGSPDNPDIFKANESFVSLKLNSLINKNLNKIINENAQINIEQSLIETIKKLIRNSLVVICNKILSDRSLKINLNTTSVVQPKKPEPKPKPESEPESESESETEKNTIDLNKI